MSRVWVRWNNILEALLLYYLGALIIVSKWQTVIIFLHKQMSRMKEVKGESYIRNLRKVIVNIRQAENSVAFRVIQDNISIPFRCGT